MEERVANKKHTHEKYICGGMCNFYHLNSKNTMQMQGGMCRQLKIKCKNTMHYNGGMCSQNIIFLDPCITMEECVAKMLIFWTHALQWRNV